jgi:hypothetical protein
LDPPITPVHAVSNLQDGPEQSGIGRIAVLALARVAEGGRVIGVEPNTTVGGLLVDARWAMTHPLAALANRHEAKEEARRKRFVRRAAEKTQTYDEMTSRDWQGEPLDLHIVPLARQRNPRGRDGRRL